MISVSSQYKDIMNRYKRNKSFITVGIGIIDQEAQASAVASADTAYWSKGNVFNINQSKIEYATLEENYMKADGKMLFLPENNELMQVLNNGIVTDSVRGSVRIDFPQLYSIKGLTLVFGTAYPTEFTVQTKEKNLTYTNDSEKFITYDVLGDTDYIVITPVSMVGGEQRFRLQSALMGVGLFYSNEQIKSFNHSEEVSTISEELPKESTNFSFYDEENLFDVNDNNSFIDFLETMQKITISFGLELDDGSVEWHQIATNYLKSWKSQKGVVTITATDRLSQMKDKYEIGNKIYSRTAYEEAESIFADAGIAPDEYFIDDYLKDVALTNPMPKGTHKQSLQLLANACRCSLSQDENGKIMIIANFAVVLDPEDLQISTNGHTEWSKPDNILIGSDVVYAELKKDFLKADGKMLFLPEDKNYMNTSYVSEQVADENGIFETNPTISIQLPAAYTYFGVNMEFDGNPPQEIKILTYESDNLVGSAVFKDVQKKNNLIHEFKRFDKMVLEFTKGYPLNRVLLNKFSFGALSDYVLTKRSMMKYPVGYKEERVKSVRTKVYSFENDKNGKPQEVKDEVYVEKLVSGVGVVKTLSNPLVSTQEHAELLAEWMGNYYANNIYYTVDYRGEPRVKPTEVIRMESDVKNNIQVEVGKNEISFNGALSGSFELRKAVKLVGG